MTDPISSGGSMGQVQAAAQGLVPLRSAPPGTGETGAVHQGAAPAETPQAQLIQNPAVLMDLKTVSARLPEPEAPSTLEEATKAFRDYLKGLPSNLLFKADQDSGLYMFKVVNPVTQEVIRQFPPDEVLEMAKRLKEQLAKGSAGILLDEKL